jgi:hypothetical protein
MQEYTELKDERLALLSQQGDDDAFTALFLRYQRSLQIQAKKAVKRFPSIYEDEFFGYFQEKFVKLVMKFDVTRGVHFPGYCAVFFPKMAYEYARKTVQKRGMIDGHKINVGERTDTNAIPTDFSDGEIEDNRYSFENLLDMEETDLFIYLSSKSDEHAKVISLLAQNATYVQIARAFGRKGNYMALANWGKRAVERLRKSVIEFYVKNDSIEELSSYI